MPLEFEVSAVIPASPIKVYKAWLDSKSHSQMTGGKAKVSAKVGESFQAWDGYITGKNLILEPGKRIVQSWRTSEFKDSEEDSQIELSLEPVKEGTKLTLRHTNLPANGEQYEQGWVDNYFDPMKAYFGD
ncbi:MAG TPA: SRPBCC domain-containing protein [Thermoguttaceae bacterium]